MTKTKYLSYAVGLLILLNISLLGYQFLHKPKHHQKAPQEIVIERLHFDAEQIAKYDLLIATHRKTIDSLDHQFKRNKKRLFVSLSRDNQPEEADSIINQITETKRAIEYAHHHHFLDLKKICKPEQRTDFNLLTKRLGKIFKPHHKKK